ncbi:MAG: anti-sigma F factor [Firmicutes bacterium]|nr:anti-sigma F factor [Bacillota bacterium]
MENRFHMEFSAVSENESFARLCISAFLLPCDPTVNDMTDIKTAVSEAVTNAIIHGYEGVENGIVTLDARLEKNILHIKVSDTGKGIANIEEARKPLFTTGSDRERSGMGFTVMEAFTDKMAVESEVGKGTTVTMQKRLKCYG